MYRLHEGALIVYISTGGGNGYRIWESNTLGHVCRFQQRVGDVGMGTCRLKVYRLLKWVLDA